jgi:pteridine reductase
MASRERRRISGESYMSGDNAGHMLAGQTALITGGARRLGAAMATAFHRAGANVVLHYRSSRQDAETLASRFEARRPGSCLPLQADLLDMDALPELVARATARFGGLDILVNNASSFYPTPVGEISAQHWDELIGSNLKAPLFLSQAAAPWLRRHGRGLIINLVDIHARRPLPGHAVYCSAKAGLEMLTYSMAQELAPDIRVNAIAPGAILWPESGMNEAEKTATLAEIPLGRTGRPEDIAACALYLACEGRYVNGQVIAVDGGRHLGF